MMRNGVSNGDRTRNPRSHSPKTFCQDWWSGVANKIDSTAGELECWPWTGRTDVYGYGVVSADGRDRRVPRLVLQRKLARALRGSETTRHTCDNPICCNPAHLVSGSQLENIADRNARGRTASGERIPWAKLTDAAARAIAADTVSSSRGLADRFGVSEKTITDIRAGRRWSSVTGLANARKQIPYERRHRSALEGVLRIFADPVRLKVASGVRAGGIATVGNHNRAALAVRA